MTRPRGQRIEPARYEADRAARQYHACEPENRRVARTPERRWDEALRAVRRPGAEFERFTRTQPRPLGEAERERIGHLAGEVPAWWRAATTPPADRRRVVRRLIGRVVLNVAPGDDRVAVRVRWAGGAVREQTIRRDVRGYKHQQAWQRLSARLAAPRGRGGPPKAIAEALGRDGFRPPTPRPASRFTAGMVRRLLPDLGLRARVPRRAASSEAQSRGEWGSHVPARAPGRSPRTLHGWRKTGGGHVRQVGGRGGPWAVWGGASELARLPALRDCPRLWTRRERLAASRVPGRGHG